VRALVGASRENGAGSNEPANENDRKPRREIELQSSDPRRFFLDGATSRDGQKPRVGLRRRDGTVAKNFSESLETPQQT
jgi:hypothetical protein